MRNLHKRLTKEIVNKRLSTRGIKLISSYINTNTTSTFECSRNHQWNTIPGPVLRGGNCPYCIGKLLTKDIINERIAHKGITLIGDYISSHVKTQFRCSKGHTWEATSSNVIHNSGCPSCAQTGFNPNKPGFLYYIKVETRIFLAFKIGVTNYSVKERFNNVELNKIEIIKTWFYESGKDALEVEQHILKHYKKFKYTGDPLLQTGNTELFNRDVMGLY